MEADLFAGLGASTPAQGAQPGQADTTPAGEPTTSEPTPAPDTGATAPASADPAIAPGHPDTTAPDPAAAHRDPKNGMILGKYKTIDDLVKGYQSLRGEMSKKGELEKMVSSTPATTPQQAPQPGQVNDQFIEQVRASLQQDPAGTIVRLMQMTYQQAMQQAQAQVAPIQQSLTLQQVAQELPDFDQYRPEMQAVLQETPAFAEAIKSNPAMLKSLYYAAKGRSVQRIADEARKNGQTEARVLDASKTAAGATSPSAPRSGAGKDKVGEIVDDIFGKPVSLTDRLFK